MQFSIPSAVPSLLGRGAARGALRVARVLAPAAVLTCGLTVASSLLLGASSARADQFIVTDVSYTHSGATTMDSHYHVDPLPGTPKNLKSPVDYSQGSVHVLLEVKTKPGDTPTKFQICFEGSPGYGCTEQSPTYTKTGSYEWTTKVSSQGFYLGNGGPDWTKGINSVALILKDTNNGKPQGDPKYVPTDLHVQVAFISSGASFAPPAPSGADAGAGDAARPAPGDAGSAVDASSGAPTPPRDASTSTGTGGGKDAGTTTPISRDAGTPVAAHDDDDDAGKSSDGGAGSEAKMEPDSGCSVGSRSLSGGFSFALALVLLGASRRRRSPRVRVRV
jgi:hypothetical protein